MTIKNLDRLKEVYRPYLPPSPLADGNGMAIDGACTKDDRRKISEKLQEILPHADLSTPQQKFTLHDSTIISALDLAGNQEPVLHDTIFNNIPAACFEIGAALAILDHPGKIGEIIDRYAQSMSKVIEKIYSNEEVGSQKIKFNGEELTLRQLFDKKIIREFKPTTDQIGRCTDHSLDVGESWIKGNGKDWLIGKLKSTSGDGRSEELLTKMRASNAFGAVIWESLHNRPEDSARNEKILATILPVGESCGILYKMTRDNLGHEELNHEKGRARIERAPYVNGQSLGGHPDVKMLPNGITKGESFGKIYHKDEIKNLELAEQYAEAEKQFGRQGIKRVGDPIKDQTRPGLLSELAVEKMPSSFKALGLDKTLKKYSFDHGSGISRWSLCGEQAKASWDHEKPAAGAYSLGAVVMLLGMGCLNETHDDKGALDSAGKKFLGDPNLQAAGLAISSFMGCGYHSAVETFPIAMAAASGKRLEVPVSVDVMKNLYQTMAGTAKKYAGPEAAEKIEKYLRAYDGAMKEFIQQHDGKIAAKYKSVDKDVLKTENKLRTPNDKLRDVAKFFREIQAGPDERRIQGDVELEAYSGEMIYGAHINRAQKEWGKLGMPDVSLHIWTKNNPNYEIEVHGKQLALKNMARLDASPDNSKKYKVTMESGLWTWPNGQHIDTSKSDGKSDYPGYGVIVIHSDGEARVHDYVRGSLGHTSTTQGKAVKSAGIIKIVDGKAKGFCLDSGHYRPDTNELRQMLVFFKKNGVDISEMKFDAPHLENKEDINKLLKEYGAGPTN